MLIFSYIAIYLDIILKAKGESDAFAKKKNVIDRFPKMKD
jgi:hypothetical protein